MAKARTPRMQAIVVLIAGLAVAVVWAGTALSGGSGGEGKATSTPAQQSDTGKRQDGSG